MGLALLGGASFLVTVALVPLVIRLARKFDFLDHPGPRKIHATPIPYGGGLAVAAGVLLVQAGGRLFRTAASAGPPRSWLVDFPDEVLVALGSLVILVLGVVDDRRRLAPRFKLIVQAIVATGVALAGPRLELFDAGPWIGVPVTVLWILAVTNAFNLLDHMDGLSSGVAAIAGGALLVVALQTGQLMITGLLVPLVGACLGFLCWNFPPAKIFLGDAGSLFIGFWLACLTVSFTFYEAHTPLYTYLVPLAVLAVPLFDTSSVVLIRLARRRPIFEGDTNHLAHRLSAMGVSRRRTVLVVYSLAVLAGVAAALLYHVEGWTALLVFLQLALVFGIITLLESPARHEG